jgi:hypothetical protein
VIAWLKANYHSSCVFEIKSATASSPNTVRAKALEDHQKLALQDAKSPRGLIHKISDESRRQQPFDGFYVVSVPAYVIACFPKHGTCLVYDVDQWEGCRYDDEALFKIDI